MFEIGNHAYVGETYVFQFGCDHPHGRPVPLPGALLFLSSIGSVDSCAGVVQFCRSLAAA